MWLGFWQIDRLAWKEDLLSRIDANMKGEPIPYTLSLDGEDLEYKRVCAEGIFLHDRELYVFGSSIDGRGGILVYTPLRVKGGFILINRGFVPNEFQDPETRLAAQTTGPQKVCGVLRQSREKASFTADNNPAENRWFTPNVQEMATALKLESVGAFFLETDATANPGGYPIGGQTFVDIPNNHLGYAITWFGLALVLVIIFTLFVRRQRKD